MRVAAATFVALAFVSTAGAAVTRARYLMGTVCEIAVSGTAADIDRAFAEAERIERFLSTWHEDSELSRVNRGETQPGAELRALLDTTLEWSRRTDRAFDPRIGHLIFATRRGAPAAPAGIPRNLIEEGAFGKGYALDRMLALIDADEAMLDFGGQILTRGAIDVRIADPEDRRKPVLAFTLTNASLSTSSSSEKKAHIVDPRTGEILPPRGSVSVIASDALTADILSTALYVMGEDEGLRWADRNQVAAIFINDQQIRLSARAPRVTVLDRKFKVKD